MKKIMTLNKQELLKFKTSSNNELPYTKMNEFMDYVYQNDLYEYTDNIYDDNGIRDTIRNDIDKSGWERIKYLLENVKDTNCYYLIKDGYGNFKNITNIDINNIIDTIIYDLDKNKDGDYEYE